jgi:prepilin-type N-terminal cleavage/methylation domain-containing protein
MRRHPNGFTLIELAIVLLIIAITVTVVFPKLGNGFLQQAQLRGSVNRLASFAEYAYQHAAITRLTHLLYLDTEMGTYWVTSQASDDQAVPVTDTFNLKGRLPENVRFLSVELQGMGSCSKDIVTIRFSPLGWADPAKIHLICSTGETMAVIINELSGRVDTRVSEEMN